MTLPKIKEQDGLVFHRKPYTDEWFISGIDICRHLGYKNPLKQANQIYDRFKENFKETSELIKIPRSKKDAKGLPQFEGTLFDQNYQYLRCYSRPGLWFFTSKCNLAKANHLTENLFNRFDELLKSLQNTKSSSWLELREKGKIDRKHCVEGIEYHVEFAEDNGSKNADRYYSIYTQEINKAASGLKKPPKNFRNIATSEELSIFSAIESKISEWIQENIPLCSDYHDVFPIIKEKIYETGKILRNILIKQRPLSK